MDVLVLSIQAKNKATRAEEEAEKAGKSLY